MSDYVWSPPADDVARANVTRLARNHHLDGLPELRARSVADIGWFWDAVVKDLGLPFRQIYTEVVDISRGIEHPDWFIGARLNIVDACLERWRGDPDSADQCAVVHESEDGTVRTMTYRELAEQVERASAGLRARGIRKGDAVALFLPMIPEAIIAFYAAARIGAVVVPLFSGFAPTAIAARLQDAAVVAVIVADGTLRRGKQIAMKPLLDEALATFPTVAHVIVVSNAPDLSIGAEISDRELAWEDLVNGGGDPGEPELLDANDTLLLGYTSGTTGRPKGAIHTHSGFLVKIASEVAYSFDVRPGDVFCWVTDMGWIMGPLSIVGAHANGAAVVLYEGSPDVPDLSRLWRLVERHRVTMLGVSPTLIRTLRLSDQPPETECDLASVRALGSTGEPWDPDSYAWLARDLFGARVPVINFSGGTEVGGSFLAPYPVEPIRSCSLGGPSLGMDVDVVDDTGEPVRGDVGELVCRQPWPSMTRGIWRDEDRYLEAYWSTFPGMWHHGDYAFIDHDGQWYIRGRSDDVMNVAGKRLAPAEVEAVMVTHPAVSEAAAVGVLDATKGEVVWAFWVPRPDATDDVSAELREMVSRELGKPFAPRVVHRVERLPKTRSAKILRRAIRAAATGGDAGDLSGAENPEAIEEIRTLVAPSNSS